MSGIESLSIILASGSPRRRELLKLIGLKHKVLTSNVDETPLENESGIDFAARACADKARAVAKEHPDTPVLGADTVVEIAGEILGKPGTETRAEAMLAQLSGRQHMVHTAMALVLGDRCEVLVDSTIVQMRPLEASVISWYIDSGEPLDKAGAYAIQGIGGLLVDSISGSAHTVVGLPLHRLPELFSRFDMNLWTMLAKNKQ